MQRQPGVPEAAIASIYAEMVKHHEGAQWRWEPQARQLACPKMGVIKQKTIAWKWWVPGSHQLLLWIDGRYPFRQP